MERISRALTEEIISSDNPGATSVILNLALKDEETKEVQYITFFYGDPIDEGDRLTVQYLPNSKFGVLIERNGEITGKKIE